MKTLRKESVYIGLGSNMDNPMAHVCKAQTEIKALPEVQWIASSSIYLSEPMGVVDQNFFLNACLLIETSLNPFRLLAELQSIEAKHQRTRQMHWGPRTLDLDILLCGDRQLNHPWLILPHPRIKERAFVLEPLRELNSSLVFPDKSCIQDYQGKGFVKKIVTVNTEWRHHQ